MNSTQPLPNVSLDGREQLGEVDVVGVELVDDEHAGQAALAGLVEHAARVDLDAVGGGDDDDRGLDGVQRAQGLADEVGLAGRVEQVDVLALVLEVQDAGVDRELVFVLLVVEVGDAGAVVDAAAAVDGLGLEEQGVGQRGLAAARCPTRAMLRMSLSCTSACDNLLRWERGGFAEGTVLGVAH